MPTIERIQDVTLSNGRVIINKLGRTYSVTTFDHDNETTHTPGLTYPEAMNLLADLIKADVLETN
jgi:hypothetical protein